MESVNRSKLLVLLLKQLRLNQSSTLLHSSKRFKTGYGTGASARVQAALDEETEQHLNENRLKPKQHPGTFRVPKVSLPEKFRYAAEKILLHSNVKAIAEEAANLQNYIWSRRLPTEQNRLQEKASKIEEEIRSKDEALLPFLSGQQARKLEKRTEQQFLKRMRSEVYHWAPIKFSKQKPLEYLFVRSAPEYATLYRIFNEISKRDPHFQPATLCDFGSGIGTVSWAARTFWSASLREHLCADVSWEMNELSELIMRGGSKNNDHPIPALFYRQNLPESYKIRYDLVVSAFSLMEMPTANDRLTVIDKLWKKTEDCLVIVEPGTIAGFRAVIEARNYVLGLGTPTKPNCHVFSPCPQSGECPRFSFDVIPCNYEIKYRPLHPFHADDCKNERFCYVVIRRGRRNQQEPEWPRLVQEPKIRARHVICRLCTKDATISEIVLTKAKHSQQLRLIAKRSKWGDLLPVNLHEQDVRKEEGNW